MLRILGRHNDGKESKNDNTTYKRGEPDGSEEVTAHHKTKIQTSKKDIVKHEERTAYLDQSDIEIYPVNQKEKNGGLN